MKTCNTCKTRAPNNTLFCPTCGSSYSTKLCPKLHPNPPTADYCLSCGSPQLSRPHHPRLPNRFRRAAVTVFVLALALISIAYAAFFYLQSDLSFAPPALIRFFANLLAAFRTTFQP